MVRENPLGVSGDQIGINPYYQTAANRQPATDNYLNNNSSLSFGFVEQPTKFGTRLQLSGSQYDFETLEVSFIVDENIRTYMEIYDWMRSLGNLEDQSEYVDITRHQTEAQLLILSSSYNPIYCVDFKGVFPISMSSIDFDSTVTETEPVIVTATFQYRSFDITPL